jgi:hypothetical protein
MNKEQYVKLGSLMPTETNSPTIQLQPQQNSNNIKIVHVGNHGSVKNYINNFILFNNIKATIHEMLHTQETVFNSLNTLDKIPIIEIYLSNDVRLYFSFTPSKSSQIIKNSNDILNTIVSGAFTLDLYNATYPLNISESYEYSDKKNLLEDLITYLFDAKVKQIIKSYKHL